MSKKFISLTFIVFLLANNSCLAWFGKDEDELNKSQQAEIQKQEKQRQKHKKEERKKAKDKEDDDGFIEWWKNREKKDKNEESFWQKDKKAREQRKKDKERLKLLKEENKLLKEKKKLQGELISQPIKLYELNKQPSFKDKITTKFKRSHQNSNVLYQKRY